MKNKIYFRTNLDYIDVPYYEMDIIPPIRARVICKTNMSGFKNVNLAVVGVTLIEGRWEVELHIPSGLKTFSGEGISLRDWYKNYAGISI
jgi:hypothetical protein